MDQYLTVGEAAKLLAVSVRTLRRWDGAGKLRARRHPANNYRLYDGVEVRELASSLAAAKGPAPVAAARSNVRVPVSTFVGRVRELESLKKLFADGSRLITLLGPPGMGKTRLAQQFSRHWLDGATDRESAWFADLSEASSIEGLLSGVAHALGNHLAADGDVDVHAAQLGRALAPRGRTLLILDNFEGVVAHAPETVGRWLADAPEVSLLVTSRELLNIDGEIRFELAPLGPADALELFEGRARARCPDLAWEDSDRAAASDIVARVDGIPLAIELAAARIGVMSPAELRDRLAAGSTVLRNPRRDAPARHQTLAAAIEWSWNHLAAHEQTALAQCSVFRGGFDLDAADAIVELPDGSPSVTDALQALLDRSLLHAVDRRLDLYMCVRDYAAARLTESGGESAALDRHTSYFGRAADDWSLDRLAREHANLWAVVQRGRERADDPGQLTDALRGLLALNPLAAVRGPFAVYAAELDYLLEASAVEEAPVSVRARAHVALAWLRLWLGELDNAYANFDRAASLASPDEHPDIVGAALGGAAYVTSRRGDLRRALEQFDAAFALLPRSADRAYALGSLGTVQFNQGKVEAAHATFVECLELAREFGPRTMEGYALSYVAAVANEQGRLEEAVSLYEQAVAVHEETSDRRGLGMTLANYAYVLQSAGRRTRARAHYERALAILDELGYRIGACAFVGYFGTLEEDEGDLEKACELYRSALALCEEVGEQMFAASMAAYLGGAAADLGRFDEARAAFSAADAHLASGDSPRLLEALAIHRLRLELAVSGDVAAIRTGMERGRAFAAQSTEVRMALQRLESALARNDLGPPDALVVDREGRWFRPPGGRRVDLSRRRSLSLLVRHLADRQMATPGEPSTRDELLSIGWPDESMRPDAGATRVRVALSKLRRLGLRAVLVSRADGYLFDPQTPIVRA